MARSPRTILDDASRLNPTPVHRHVVVPPDAFDAQLATMRGLLKQARAESKPFCVSAARHSMGGQSLVRDGVAVTLDGGRPEADTKAMTYRVGAGTRWREVVRALDPIGFSPSVMQSNSDFGVGATFSVNAHGWAVPHGPCGTTVRSIRLLLADGTLMECSRETNPDLFALAMGGYGMVGIVLDLELEMSRNVLLTPSFAIMPSSRFADEFMRVCRDGTTRMAYGRLSVARSGFLEEAILVSLKPNGVQPDPLPPITHSRSLAALSRGVYRLQQGGEAFKRFRWSAETRLVPAIGIGSRTRNAIMSEPVSTLAGRDRRRSDILHEYFLPPDRLMDFVQACREELPASAARFLNVTLRYVGADPVSVLGYAPAPRIAAVMSFSQSMTPEGEADMMALTERMIERVLDMGGTFYLPYRLHARPDQVERGYPGAGRMRAGRATYDPGRVFRNAMSDAYFS